MILKVSFLVILKNKLKIFLLLIFFCILIQTFRKCIIQCYHQLVESRFFKNAIKNFNDQKNKLIFVYLLLKKVMKKIQISVPYKSIKNY